MIRAAGVLLILVGLAVPAWSQGTHTPPDRLGQALDLVGWTREDLGFRPKGYWSRYPNPEQMAHKLPFFDDLLAEPLHVYDFTRVMAMAVNDNLAPTALKENQDALYQLVYFLGVDRKITAFRAYSANLHPDSMDEDPLYHAIERIYARTGTDLIRTAFGDRFERRSENLRNQSRGLPPALARAVADLVLNVLNAHTWRQRAFRNVDFAHMVRVFDIRDLAHIMDDGRVYYSEIDDLARDLDEESLYYACMKTVQAADDARRDLDSLLAHAESDLDDVHFNFMTPIGRVVVSGTGDDLHSYNDAAVLIDLGGDDRYTGPVGATPALDVPISVAIDCAGNDLYQYEGDLPAQGAGILGAGVLVDQSGDDQYRARHYAQGLGVFGLGLLFDRAGDDQYTLEMSGQGAAYFGLGYHLDGAGDDQFYLFGDGQGFGGPGGVGVLANYTGNDHYVAEALAEKAGRPDYHSQGRISYSNAQGMGAGRRGDGSDGHNWAGGLGVLLDMHGNDTYEAGNFSMGVGYMYGTGLLYDGSGDDDYRSVYFTQASGAHFCIGALIDAGGNDRHELYDTGGAGLGFGWDFAVAMLIDEAGDDEYRARGNSMARADIRSNAFLLDLGGDDRYIYPEKAGGLGIAPFRPEYRQLGYSYGPYNYYANSVGLFLDLGGNDEYLDLDRDTGETEPAVRYGNDMTWQQPAPDSEEYGYRSYGVGMDVPDGRVPELERLDGAGPEKD